MPVQFTTELPDARVPTLDDSTEDEIGVSWSDVIDYGDYRIEYKESSTATWTAHAVVDDGTTSTTITDLEDGEEYEVRLRTETEHVTGTWAVASIVTNFPLPTNPNATLSSTNPKTQIDLSFTDNADNEDGARILRQREYDYGWGPWQEIEDFGPSSGTGTVTYADDTVSPGNTYRYKFEAYTEDASNTSETTNAVTTDSSSEPRERTGAGGWEVKVEHPGGRALRPSLLDAPKFTPALNDYPRVEIPVLRDEKWQTESFEGASLSIWRGGQILPIEEIAEVRMEADRTMLVGRGGSALDKHVQAEYDSKEAHVAVKELGQQHTPYQMNVDDLATNIQTNETLLSGDSESDLASHLKDPPSSTDAARVTSGGELELLQSCFVVEGEKADSTSGSAGAAFGSGYEWASGGEIMYLNSQGDAATWSFPSLDYTIPASRVGLKFRREQSLEHADYEFNLYVNGNRYHLATLDNGRFMAGRKWSDNLADEDQDYLNAGYNGPDLQPGDIIEFEAVQTSSNTASTTEVEIDIIALYDSKYSYNWANQNDGNGGYLAGPELYPPSLTFQFDEVVNALAITGGQLDVSMNDTSGDQQLEMSNDLGKTWTTAMNTSTFETNFASAGGSLRSRVTLSRYGTQTGATPTQGVVGQTLDGFTLSGDLEDTPVLSNRVFDGSLEDIWNEIADDGDLVWELQRDQSGWSVEWTRPGQRTADSTAGLVDYTVSKRTHPTYEKAVIKGAAQPVRRDPFTAIVGESVSLTHERLIPSTEIVRNPRDGTVYTVDEDYQLDCTAGEITVLSSGSMVDGDSYEIDYEYKSEASYTADGAGANPTTVVETIPGLSGNRACLNAAYYVVQRMKEPVWEATVTVPRLEAGRSLVDALALEDLPTAGTRMEIRSLEQTPEEVRMELGSRESIGDLITDLNNRVNSVADRV